MLSRPLLKALFKKEVYTPFSGEITDTMIPDDLRSLYATLVKAHSTYTGDITPLELYELHVSSHPTLTDSKKQMVKLLCESIAREPDVSVEVAKDLLVQAKKADICNDLIHRLLDIQNGRTVDIEGLKVQCDAMAQLDQANSSDLQTEGLSFDTDSLEEYLDEDIDQDRWAINIPALNAATRGGIWRSSFGIIAARPDCYSEDTEVLTSTGWMLFKDVTPETKVAAYHEDTNVTFEVPEAIIEKEYKGNMVHFTHSQNRVDLLVTPGHDMVYRDYKGGIYKQKACGKPSSISSILMAGQARRSTSRFLSPKEQLLIAYQADGSGPKKGCNGKHSGHQTIRFGFTKERKKERLRRILRQCDYVYKESTEYSKPGYTTFYVQIPLGDTFSKVFSSWVDLGKVNWGWGRQFLKELAYWDGTVRSGTRSAYVSTVKDNADIVTAIAALSGVRTNLRVDTDNRSAKFSDVYAVGFDLSKESTPCRPIQQTVVPYDGKVYCVGVSTGMIIVRRNNKVAICGNCGKSAFALYLACGPGGFLSQGANVHIWRNEEAGIHILRRAINTCMSWPIWSNSAFIKARMDEVKAKFQSLPGRLTILKDNATDYKSMGDLERYCKANEGKIDVLIIDQLDKMTLNGGLPDDRTDLREIYVRARGIGKRHGISVLAITQAGSNADGKLWFGYNDLDESKTGKAAEADYIFCIGAQFAGQPEKDNGYRMCNLAKNKLGGPHAPIPFICDLETSTMRE